jgi:hypothetical protein
VRPARGIGIGLMDLADFRLAERLHRLGEIAAIGQRRRPAHLPAVGVIRRQLGAALPRFQQAALADTYEEEMGEVRSLLKDIIKHFNISAPRPAAARG